MLLGAAFCTLNLYGWDGDTGQHPDERFMTSVADRAEDAGQPEPSISNSSRNPLNPRNSGNTFYVYGLLPQTLTHLTAVVLTPHERAADRRCAPLRRSELGQRAAGAEPRPARAA